MKLSSFLAQFGQNKRNNAMKSMGLLLREVVKTVVRFVLLPASGRGDRTPRLTRSRGIWMARSGALGERVNGLVL